MVTKIRGFSAGEIKKTRLHEARHRSHEQSRNSFILGLFGVLLRTDLTNLGSSLVRQQPQGELVQLSMMGQRD